MSDLLVTIGREAYAVEGPSNAFGFPSLHALNAIPTASFTDQSLGPSQVNLPPILEKDLDPREIGRYMHLLAVPSAVTRTCSIVDTKRYIHLSELSATNRNRKAAR